MRGFLDRGSTIATLTFSGNSVTIPPNVVLQAGKSYYASVTTATAAGNRVSAGNTTFVAP